MKALALRMSLLVVALAALAACAPYRDIGPAPGLSGVRSMPVQVHTPDKLATDTFVVLYSGDGGSSGGNRKIAKELSALGVPIVDVDSLIYFWRRRSLEDAALDLDALIAHYAKVFGTERVVLAGYSFGGSALPGLVRRLPEAARSRIRSVVLVAPRDYVEMTLRPHSWIDLRPPHAKPLLPDIEALAWTRRVCVYGETDKLAACPRLPPGLMEVHRLPGGHRFNGDYSGVAAILEHEAH